MSRFGDVSRFADPTISERFVWKKKIESSLAEGQVDVRQFTARAERERQVRMQGPSAFVPSIVPVEYIFIYIHHTHGMPILSSTAVLFLFCGP